jgi:hypothetical protein
MKMCTQLRVQSAIKRDYQWQFHSQGTTYLLEEAIEEHSNTRKNSSSIPCFELSYILPYLLAKLTEYRPVLGALQRKARRTSTDNSRTRCARVILRTFASDSYCICCYSSFSSISFDAKVVKSAGSSACSAS